MSLIIPTKNQHAILDQALQSISRANLDGFGDVELLVVDNQSDDTQSQKYLRELPAHSALDRLSNISVIPFNEPFNYSKMNNIAASQATGDVLCFLNNDVEVITNDWLFQLSQNASQPNMGCSGALLFYPNNTVQHAGVVMGMDTIAGHAYVGLSKADTQKHPYFLQPRNCSAVTGACLAVSQENFKRVQGFDESLAVAFNDVDFCLKLGSLGLSNQFLPHVQLYHHESLSRGKGIKTDVARKRHKKDIKMLKKRWGKTLSEDPYWLRLKTQHDLASNAQNPTTKKIGLPTKANYFLHKDLE